DVDKERKREAAVRADAVQVCLRIAEGPADRDGSDLAARGSWYDRVVWIDGPHRRDRAVEAIERVAEAEAVALEVGWERVADSGAHADALLDVRGAEAPHRLSKEAHHEIEGKATISVAHADVGIASFGVDAQRRGDSVVPQGVAADRGDRVR